MTAGIIFFFLIVILIFTIVSLSKDNSPNIPNSIDTHSSDISVTEQSRYDFFINKFNNEEQKVIEMTNKEIKEAQIQLDATTDPIKKMFLQSYIDHYKNDYLTRLINYSKFKEDDMTNDLDTEFIQVAEKVILKQNCNYEDFLNWLGFDMNIQRRFHIINQLTECGIIDGSFEDDYFKICVNSLSSLNKILKKSGGNNLLTIEDKVKLNSYYEQKRQELIGEHEQFSELLSEVPYSYSELVKAYDTLSSSDYKWEIISSQSNTEPKSYANTLIDRKNIYSIHRKSFNFLKVCKNVEPPYFEFEKGGICFYIYPDFVIAARNSTNFDVIPIKDFTINFRKQKFVETTTSTIPSNSVLIPKDAKLVSYTYKYINKNGERDARYSNNPRYGVYEYGNIVFFPYKLTMQFSNSEFAEIFYKKVQMHRNGGKEIVDPIFGATESFYNKAIEVSGPLCEFYDRILNERKISRTIDYAITEQVGGIKSKTQLIFLADLVKCYKQLGHDALNLFSLEGLPMSIVEGHIVTNSKTTYNNIQSEQYRNETENLNNVNRSIIENFLKDKSEDFFYLNEIFKACDYEDLKMLYFSLLYRFFSIIAKANDIISQEESKWLEKLMLYSTISKGNDLQIFEKKSSLDDRLIKLKQVSQVCKSEDEVNPLSKIQSMIGLSKVKDEVSALANFVKIQQERKKKGMKVVGLSYHCVFTGNPGTGKTTVARILAEIYRDLGILKKGHLIETDRSGLVAEYVGQTAIKTNKIIDSALDGMLFIDEAYSLVQGGSNDYGQEAISTLLKRMEDDRDRLIVVLAGYSEDMKSFINSNPGLQSRFNRYIHFADYTADELKQIFMMIVEKNQYLLDEEGQSLLEQILKNAIDHKDKKFGNGRYVRNLFEKSILNQAIRLSSQPKVTTEELSKLKAEDLPRDL